MHLTGGFILLRYITGRYDIRKLGLIAYYQGNDFGNLNGVLAVIAKCNIKRNSKLRIKHKVCI